MPRGGRRFLAILFFLGIPFFLSLGSNHLLFEATIDTKRVAAEFLLEETFNRLEADKDPVAHFSRFFQRIEKKTFSTEDSQKTWLPIASFLKRRYPGQIETVFLDGTGTPVAGLCDRQVAKPLSRQFFKSYQILIRDKEPLTSVAKSFMRSFLGRFVPLDQAIHGRLVLSTGRPNRQYIYFSPPSSKGMIVLFFKPLKTIEEIAVEEKVSRLNRTQYNLRLCPVVRGERSEKAIRKLSLKGLIDMPFWKEIGRSPKGKRWFGDVLIGKRVLFSHLWIVGCMRISRDFFGPVARGSVFLPFLLLILACLAFLISRLSPIDSFLGSVRFKLLLSFLYAAVVPLLIMEITSNSFLEERRLVLEEQIHRKSEASIIAADRRYNARKKNLEEEITKHFFASDYLASDSYGDFLLRLEIYRKKYGFNAVRIFDNSGKLAFDYQDPALPPIFTGQLQAIVKTSQKTLQALRPENKNPVRNSGDIEGLGFPEEFRSEFTYFFFQEVRMGPMDIIFASLPLGDEKNQIKGIAYLIWLQKNFAFDYIKKTIPLDFGDREEGECFAWAIDDNQVNFPPNFRFFRLAIPLMNKVVSSIRSFRTGVFFKGRKLLLTGLRGSCLKDFAFLKVVPTSSIEQEIRDYSWKFRFIAIAIIGLCVIVGFFLARFFIVPIDNLSEGLMAISNRNFKFEIPVLAEDELGNLARLFNEAMGDLKDLEVAKTLQESLFPRKSLEIGKWQIYGSCLPTTQVGGDYFDYFAIDDRRVILIIGDVSGHGVGAALVVAMAKAIIGHPSTSGKPFEILVSLNSILFSILKRKKMMSCCLALFDLAGMTLTLANAGQNYPILLKEGTPRFLELNGYPLGSTKNWKAATRSYPSHPGEVTLFYTDGLIEALDKSGDQIGYDRFLEALPSLIRHSAIATEGAIREWHNEMTGNSAPGDDISLVIIQEQTFEAAVT